MQNDYVTIYLIYALCQEGSLLLQYFPNHRYRSAFCKNSTPHLEYVCHVGADASHMPRSMHEHDYLCEVVLITQGAGIYMIDGQRYTAQKGDLIFYTYRFTFLPILICVPVLLLLSAVIPSVAYQTICRDSVVNRLREN